jgi:hypothetical protein
LLLFYPYFTRCANCSILIKLLSTYSMIVLGLTLALDFVSAEK